MRQARRQGLLIGNRLSPVQQKALRVVEYLDAVERAAVQMHERVQALKLAMGASGDYEFAKLFPEAWGREPQPSGQVVRSEPAVPTPQPQQIATVEDTGGAHGADVEYDYSGVSWTTPTESPELYDELMRKVTELSDGHVNGSQIIADTPHFGEWR